MSGQDTRVVMQSLIKYLLSKNKRDNLAILVEKINCFSEKNIKEKDIRYFLKKEKVIYKWMIEAAMLSSINEGWMPSNELEKNAFISTFGIKNSIDYDEIYNHIESKISGIDLGKLKNFLKKM